jgi:uncharacterized protein YdaU (DUF1376 family)
MSETCSDSLKTHGAKILILAYNKACQFRIPDSNSSYAELSALPAANRHHFANVLKKFQPYVLLSNIQFKADCFY